MAENSSFRPTNLDPATPTGSDSPRTGDDELRTIKHALLNAYNDLTNTNRSLTGIQTSPVYATNVTATGTTSLATTTITNLTVSGTLTLGTFAFAVSGTGASQVLNISRGGTVVARINADNDLIVEGDVTAEGNL